MPHQFAIVDIETTGGSARFNGITEIAIVLVDGNANVGQYTTLVNPQMPIQPFVQHMTGITDKLVATAPLFKEVAHHIYNLIKDRIFVAHNVNFDYSFVKHQLQEEGFLIDLPKICTVRLSRKVFPGLPKYGLGSLSKHFEIENNARHRAMGDAMALYHVFTKILDSPKGISEIEKLTKKRKAAQYLPPNLNLSSLEHLPSLPGVYYFYNKKQKIIYIGKAINLKKRVSSHFSNNKISKQKQDFLRDIYDIKFETCSSDLMAAVLESVEIKKYWPIYNKSQKHYEKQFGIYNFIDSAGYKRLAIDTKKKLMKPLLQLSSLHQARNVLQLWAKDYEVHPYLFFLAKEAPDEMPTKKSHNKKVDRLTKELLEIKTTYLVHDGTGLYFLVKEGILYGYTKLKQEDLQLSLEELLPFFTVIVYNNVAQSLVLQYAQQNDASIINF